MWLLQVFSWRTIRNLSTHDILMICSVILVGHTSVALSDKYVPEFNDKQAFEISWLTTNPVVRAS